MSELTALQYFDDDGSELCAWCEMRRVNDKRGKPVMLAKGLVGGWLGICKACYTRRRDNKLMAFKPLAEPNKDRNDDHDTQTD